MEMLKKYRKVIFSLFLGILTGTVFVSSYFPPENDDFHLSRFWESFVISIVMWLGWYLLLIAISNFRSLKNASRPFLKALFAALMLSISVGILTAVHLAYIGFVGDHWDWFKTHNTFTLHQYLSEVIPYGLLFGVVITLATQVVLSFIILIIYVCFLRKTRRITQ